MWIQSYHRFLNRAGFLAACDAAGWPRDPLDAARPAPPTGVALVEVGPHIGRPSVGPDGVPVPGDVIDPRWHVNVGWHAMEVPESFAEAAIFPATPSATQGIAVAYAPPESGEG
jgi:hypothetical protein